MNFFISAQIISLGFKSGDCAGAFAHKTELFSKNSLQVWEVRNNSEETWEISSCLEINLNKHDEEALA